MVYLSTPRQVTIVAGFITFFSLISKPRSVRRFLRVSKEAFDLLTYECPIQFSKLQDTRQSSTWLRDTLIILLLTIYYNRIINKV